MNKHLQSREKTSSHGLLTFITCLSNGTSLLAVACPYKNQEGRLFWCPYRNVDFSAYNRAQDNQLQKATGQNYVYLLPTQLVVHQLSTCAVITTYILLSLTVNSRNVLTTCSLRMNPNYTVFEQIWQVPNEPFETSFNHKNPFRSCFVLLFKNEPWYKRVQNLSYGKYHDLPDDARTCKKTISFPEPTCLLLSIKTRSSGIISFQRPRI